MWWGRKVSRVRSANRRSEATRTRQLAVGVYRRKLLIGKRCEQGLGRPVDGILDDVGSVDRARLGSRGFYGIGRPEFARNIVRLRSAAAYPLRIGRPF